MRRGFKLNGKLNGLILLAAALATPAAAAQDTAGSAPGETYRLRVENARYGRVEVSFDYGQHYMLIGRVQREALSEAADASAASPGLVLRSGGEGLAFAVGLHHVLKLRPEPAVPASGGRRAAPEACDLITDISAHAALFGLLTPTPGTPVRLQISQGELDPLPNDHPLSSEDVFVFAVTLPAPIPPAGTAPGDPAERLSAWRDAVRHQFGTLSLGYTGGALARARAQGRTIVAGTLTLKARLPEGEPDPIAAVTYSADDDLLAGQNVAPFSYDWDTRTVPDGEHVVEICAMNRDGHQITHVRALVVVNNHPAAAPTTAGGH